MTESTVNTVTLAAIFLAQLFTTYQAKRAAAKAEALKLAVEKKAEEEKTERAEVKEQLVKTTEQVVSGIAVIHSLTNSAELHRLKTIARLERDKFDKSHDPKDEAVAIAAEAEVAASIAKTEAIPPEVLAKADFPPPVK